MNEFEDLATQFRPTRGRRGAGLDGFSSRAGKGGAFVAKVVSATLRSRGGSPRRLGRVAQALKFAADESCAQSAMSSARISRP